jgi:hypothetical protein
MPYTEFKLGGESIAGMMKMPPTAPADLPSHWLVYFAVSDVDETAAKAQELGGAVHMAPFDSPAGDLPSSATRREALLPSPNSTHTPAALRCLSVRRMAEPDAGGRPRPCRRRELYGSRSRAMRAE